MNLVPYRRLIAAKAARCELVAAGRQLADFGVRRAIEVRIELVIELRGSAVTPESSASSRSSHGGGSMTLASRTRS